MNDENNATGAVRSRRSGFRRAANVLLAVCICASALALGGAHFRVVQVGVVVVTLCAVLAQAGGALEVVPGPAWILVALGGYSLLQSVTLPLWLVELVSPHAADIWGRALQPLGEHVTRGSLSLDPGASSLEAAKWASYALAFSMASAFGSRRGAAPIITLICVSALLVTVATVAHAVLDVTSVFGVYEVKYSKPGWRIGPILNTNCLAGYLVLGSCCALGLLASGNTSRGKWLYGAAILAMSTVVAISGSRGGVAVMVGSMAAFGLLCARMKTRRGHLRLLPAAAWAALGLGLVATTAFALMLIPEAWEQLTQRDTNKLKMWAWTVPMIKAFASVGAGRGAFESAFAAYKPGGDALIYSHPENFVAQWLSEWGVVVGASAMGALGWSLRPSRFGTSRHVAALGALIGVAAILVQNLVDFSLELFAPALAVAVLLGGCFGQNLHRTASRSSSRSKHWSGAALVALASFATGAAVFRGDSLELKRMELVAQYERLGSTQNLASAQAMLSAIRGAMRTHPAEAYFPRLGAMLALRNEQNPMPWLTRALELCPVDSRTHWILANALRKQGALSQAMLEARLTAEYDPSVAPLVGTAVVRWSKELRDIERAAPLGPVGGTVLQYAAVNSGAAPVALKVSLLQRAVQHAPDFAPLRNALAEVLLSSLGAQSADWNTRASLVADILSQATALDRLTPTTADSSVLRARLWATINQPGEADRQLTDRCPKLDDQEQVRCWTALLDAVAGPGSSHEMVTRASHRLVKAACTTDSDACPAALTHAGDAMSRVGDRLGALDYFQRASTRTGSVPSLLRVAEAEAALGRKPQAERALALAARRASDDQTLARQVDAKRRDLLESPAAPGQVGPPTNN